MTEIRIYPKDNLATVIGDIEDCSDRLFETAYNALNGWRDSERECYHIPLNELMTEIIKLAGDHDRTKHHP